MPGKKTPETQEQQSARFNAEVKRLIAAGELNPTDAEAALDKLLRHPIVPQLRQEEPSAA
jgi:hypothetical protein